MKKNIFIFLFFISLVVVVFLFKRSDCKNYQIDKKTYCLLEAKNQAEWEKGLMFYKSKSELNGADGMIFIFPNRQVQSFWNENTYLDLDLYWMDEETVVGKSVLPSILKTKETMTVESPKEVDRVAEIVK